MRRIIELLSRNLRQSVLSAQKSQILLSFDWTCARTERVCGGGKKPAAMDPATLDMVLLTQITLMRERLDRAAGLGQAAEVCGKARNIAKAIERLASMSNSSPMRSTLCRTRRA